jgi:quinol monooxygenase YgiN
MIPAPKIACILQIKVQIEPKDRETFLSHFKPVVARVSAEPECAYFIIGEDEPGVFRWTEGWTRDKDWFNNVLCNYYTIPYLGLTVPRCS